MNTVIWNFNARDPFSAEQDLCFVSAVAIARPILIRQIDQALREAIGERVAAAAIATQFKDLSAPEDIPVLEFDEPGILWRRAVLADPRILFILEPRGAKQPDGSYPEHSLMAAPVSANSFASRALLPECYRGLRREALPQGVAFVHHSGFFAVGEREALLRLAAKAVKPSAPASAPAPAPRVTSDTPDAEIIQLIDSETPLNQARKTFRFSAALIEQKSAQGAPPIEARRQQFLAVQRIADILAPAGA